MDILLSKIQIKRGLKANLPLLERGEPAFCTDTKEFFVGTGTQNILINDFSEILSMINDILTRLEALEGLIAPREVIYSGGDFLTVSYTKTVSGGSFI